jgi:ubiquinone biosynthesis monooxygenase Coq7
MIPIFWNNSQLRQLHGLQNASEPSSKDTQDLQELQTLIQTFRDDELEHLHTAQEEEASKATGYPLLSFVISQGCKVAIEVAKRV